MFSDFSYVDKYIYVCRFAKNERLEIFYNVELAVL